MTANLLLDVYAEINGDGKPKYTNEAQRKAALTVLAAENKDYSDIQAAIAELNIEKARADAELALIDDAFKTDRIVYGGCVARLENLTARLTTNNRKEN